MAAANPYAGPLGALDPVEVLRTTPDRIAVILGDQPESVLSQPLAPGKWSPHQIVAHLADTEFVFQARLRWMLFEDNPKLIGFDQDRWIAGWNRERESFLQTFGRYRVLRDSTLRLISSLAAQDWQRTGQHEERGLITVEDVIRTLAGHDRNHLPQFERLGQ